MDLDLTLRAKEFASKDPFPMKGFGPVEWWVGNAFMTAQAFRSLLGMEIIGYSGPETGVRDRSSYLLRHDQITFIVTASLDGDHEIAPWFGRRNLVLPQRDSPTRRVPLD